MIIIIHKYKRIYIFRLKMENNKSDFTTIIMIIYILNYTNDNNIYQIS